jgi:hypothetical protein
VVPSDFNNSVPEQNRRFQGKASKGTYLRTPEIAGAACNFAYHSFFKVPLEKYFPEYTGGSDINKAAKYILWKFMQANRAHLSVYPQYATSFLDCLQRLHITSLTQATDTSNVRLVFAAVKETILQNALKDSGIL